MRLFSIPRLAGLGLSGNKSSFLRALNVIAVRRNGRKALAHLDDHMLRDIGLTRAVAEAEVDKPFWRD